ncbi:hypothetical protein SVAN01_04104 [Stagonosporopsis vannaccii]|nr:hypothetical protein SVAN01_04104 [Stagonosporopsis vannaccii]
MSFVFQEGLESLQRDAMHTVPCHASQDRDHWPNGRRRNLDRMIKSVRWFDGQRCCLGACFASDCEFRGQRQA